ncbi:DUF6603 domain-containing protein [Actinoplanes solisilvae]|uniref:DUF6603 domain-containing protein n=1 Tax=Actinoplanes solisilvae TaxID=2486853 RepID=UPI000FD812E9|nr:DUF6603 domain-containing protein [Actinoplanes solisilvae]
MAADEIMIARAAAWLARALGAGGSFTAELDTDVLGVRLPEEFVADPAVVAAGTALGEAGTTLIEAADRLDAAAASGDGGQLLVATTELLAALVSLFDTARRFVTSIAARTSAIVDADARTAVEGLLGVLARRIADYLVISTLEVSRPRLTFLLKLLGLIDWSVVPEDLAAPSSVGHIRKAIRLDRLGDLVSDPVAHFANVHGWGTAAFDPGEIFLLVAGFYDDEVAIDGGLLGADAFLTKGPFTWRRDSSANPPGLRLDVDAELRQAVEGRVEVNESWGTTLTGAVTASGGLTAGLTPPFRITVEPKAAEVAGKLSITVNRNERARPFTIVGGNGLIELTADDVSIGAELEVGASTTGVVEVQPRVFSDLSGLTLTLGQEGADGFIASLLAGLNLTGRFDLGLEWRGDDGLVVRAAGGLETAIGMHQSLGPISFETLYLILRLTDDGQLTLEVSTALSGTLGPFAAAVDRIGALLTLSFSDDDGDSQARYGMLDAALAFKPPNGVGLSLDLEILRGGGYLFIDADRGEYAGAVELVFAQFLALSAIGLITTRMPDGGDGFSLLVIVTAEFGTPLQLGFGFTLNAVGGLVGINRSARLEELAAGVRDGSIESVMFPADVVANAPRIISDLRRFFPPEEGTFLIGLMAKLGWGAPTLVTASLGVIIEIPPGTVAVLGVLKVVLPDEDAALLVLQVNFIGAYEPDRERIWFFASLYESRILFITLGGEMGLLIAWGADADFVVSIGGFHPSFHPPPLPFPAPRRVNVSILDEPLARVRVEGYFAVTSNTVQFGASAEVFFGLDDFKLEGHLGFDALFRFSPFYFTISFSASLSVKVFGVGLFSVRIRGELEGTSPWYIEGEGSISLLFWDIDVPFSHRWGEDADTIVAAVAVLPLVREEALKPQNWTALPPSGTPIPVSLRQIDAAAGIVLHPSGSLRVAQRAVPLDLHLDTVGNQPVADVDRVTITVTDPALVRLDDADESFATAQFQALTDAQKLASPAFENQAAGVVMGVDGAALTTSHAVKRPVLHELVVIDSNFKEHLARFFHVGLEFFTHLLRGNSTARSVQSRATARALDPFASRITVGAGTYVVADLRDNSPLSADAVFTSKARADDFRRAEITRDPALSDRIHVLRGTEVRQP